MQPQSTADPRRYRTPSLGDRRDRERLRKLERAQERGVPPSKHVVCAPEGGNGQTLNEHIKELEPVLNGEARRTPGLELIAGMTDKARLSSFNNMFGKAGGDKILEEHFEILELALALVAGIKDSEYLGLASYRANDSSDEGIELISGLRLTRRPGFWFRRACDFVKSDRDLRESTYIDEVRRGSRTIAYEQDLYAVSKVLRNPGMLLASHSEMLGPIALDPDKESGFILEAIRILENREITFRKDLPPRCQGNGGLAEVGSPFEESLLSQGKERTASGSFVEIKFRLTPEEAETLRKIVLITRKCHAEVNSGLVGIRAFNTFLGKAIANALLTRLTQAMGTLAQDVPVLPVAGGYMRYWVKMPADSTTERLIRDAIREAVPSRGPAYMQLLSDPVVTVIDATDAKVEDVRARFLLRSMDKQIYEPWVLGAADTVLNVLENMSQGVKDEMFEKLKMPENGGRGVSPRDVKYMKMLQDICVARRTIRDSEDLVWVARNDKRIAEDINANPSLVKELEGWLFDFAAERYERIRYLLAERIQKESRKYRQGRLAV